MTVSGWVGRARLLYSTLGTCSMGAPPKGAHSVEQLPSARGLQRQQGRSAHSQLNSGSVASLTNKPYPEPHGHEMETGFPWGFYGETKGLNTRIEVQGINTSELYKH